MVWWKVCKDLWWDPSWHQGSWQDWYPSKSAELTSKILSCVGQSCLYNCSSRSLPSQEGIFEINSTDFEATNLENSEIIFCIWMEHYSWCDRVIRDTWYTLIHKENTILLQTKNKLFCCSTFLIYFFWYVWWASM